MGKRKAGSLSGNMIVRRVPAEKTGFLMDPAPPPSAANGKSAFIAEDAARRPIQKNSEMPQSTLPQVARAPEWPTTGTTSRLRIW